MSADSLVAGPLFYLTTIVYLFPPLIGHRAFGCYVNHSLCQLCIVSAV